MITDVHRTRMSWREIQDEQRYSVRDLASEDWLETRQRDRARLRPQLYRLHGI
jgi:hypothetical protein